MARIRLLLVALPVAALVAGSAPGYPASKTPSRAQPQMPGTPTFIISGRGWGHGVGMAQWGAYGFAREGATYDEILAHYYKGTTLGRAQISRVRVLLAEGRAKLSISSTAPFTARDGLGQLWRLPAGPQTFGPGLRLKTTDFQEPQRLPPPVTFLPGSSPLRLGGRPYRGQFQVSVANGSLRAVNSVSLEAYLYGVVPSEMPKEWLPEALKAQAVAARSYALAVRKTGSWFDLYPDTRSQVYLGISHEFPSTTAAVDETAGEVVLYQGRLITTYFFSSSGGRTASAPEVWPSSQPTPYLVSVDDPHDTISPHHRWGPFVVTAQRLRGLLGARGTLADIRLNTGPSGRVQTVTAVTSQGESSVTGSDLRRAMKLRSTWFRIGVLSLANPEAPVTFGKRVSLSGVARSLPSVRLEQRQAGATWQPVGPVRPAPGGVVKIKLKPRGPTDYRLTSGPVRSRIAHVSVAPLVRFQGMPDAGTLRGYARPVFPGASIALQRFDGSRWRTFARTTIDAAGQLPGRRPARPGRLSSAAGARPRLRPRREPDAQGGPGMRRLALATFLLALALPAPASAARFAIGVEREQTAVSWRRGSRRAPASGSRASAPSRSRSELPGAAGLSSVPGVAWVERIRASRRVMFTPSDPFAIRQWYLGRIHAFDAWTQAPNLPSVRVAVLDSGIDSGHPELRTRSRTGRASSRAPGRATRTVTARSSPARSPPA